MKNWIKRQFRKKARVYILPTKMGGYLIGLIFLMFLLSIGYSNNLLLIFTLFLFAFNLMWLIQTHFHLYRLKIGEVSIPSVHAGDKSHVQILWKSLPQGPWDWNFKLESAEETFFCECPQDLEYGSGADVTLTKRGVITWEFLKVMSTRPFGLYQTWIYFPLSQKSFAYPTLHKIIDLSLSGMEFEGEVSTNRKGFDDFHGLTSYENNESRRISWKHYARSGELLIKEGEEKKLSVLELEVNHSIAPEHKEFHLSHLASQIVECQRLDLAYSLKVNGVAYRKLQDCMRELALC
jgi:uncharacterized protein (DUF58 family)